MSFISTEIFYQETKVLDRVGDTQKSSRLQITVGQRVVQIFNLK